MAIKNTVEVTIGAQIDGLLGGMRDAVSSVNKSTDQITGHVNRMSSDTHTAMNKMHSSVKDNIERSIEKLELFEVSLNKMRTAFVLFGQVAALGWVGEKLYEMGKRAAEFGESITLAGQKTGLSTDKIQELRFAAQMSGASVELLDRAMRKLAMSTVQAQQPTSLAAAAFKAVHINASELKNMELSEVINRIADSFKGGADGINKMNIASQLLGLRGGAELIPMLNKGSKGLKEYAERARELGAVVGGPSIDALTTLEEKFKEMHAATTGLTQRIGVALIPALTALADFFSNTGPAASSVMTAAVKAVSAIFEAFKSVVVTVWTVVRTVFGMIGDLINAVFGSGGDGVTATEFFINVLKIVQVAAISLEIGFKEVFSSIGTALTYTAELFTMFGGVANAALHFDWQGIKDATKSGTKAMADTLRAGTQEMIDIAVKGREKIDNALLGTEGKSKTENKAGAKDEAVKKNLDFNPNKKAKGAGEMGAWKAELDRKHDLEQDYFKSSLADDLAFWQHKLTITKVGSKDRMAVEHELRQLRSQQAHQQLASELEDLKAQQDAARTDGVKRIQIAGEIAVKIGAAYGLESKEYKAALREMAKAAEAQQKELDKLADMQIDRAKQHALTLLDIEKERLKSEKDLRQITDEQETQGLIGIEERQYQIELDALEKKKEMIREDVAAEQKAAEEIEKLKDQHALRMKKLDDTAALDAKKRWEGILQPINAAFNTSIQGMIMGTTTLHKAMANIGQSILAEFVNTQVKLVSNWAAGEFAKTTATEVGAATRTGVEKTAAVTSLATSSSTNLKEIANAAWVAAANVYKSIAAIPYVGPFLAPAAAVAAGAAVIGFGKSVMSAEGGFDIPTGVNPITQLHQREMVLPQAQADVIRDMAANGGGGKAMHFHFNGPTDKRGIEGWFKANAHALAPALRQLSRNFTPIS